MVITLVVEIELVITFEKFRLIALTVDAVRVEFTIMEFAITVLPTADEIAKPVTVILDVVIVDAVILFVVMLLPIMVEYTMNPLVIDDAVNVETIIVLPWRVENENE